ncbi:MAG: single-stranded DNA-binding protein [Tissierellia bacterium]|nr:single-stranded DNA-binding protein [Tissierellia bacterium]
MNNVALIGRLTRDPELRYTPNGYASVNFTLAVDRRLSREKRQEAEANNQPTADFIRIVAWGKTAELIANYMTKGRQVGVEGRIQTGSYEKDGRRIYTTDVVASNITFIDSGQGRSGGNQGGFAPTNQQGPVNNFQSSGGFSPQGGPTFGQQDQGGGQDDDSQSFYPIDNDDIPF